MKTSIKSFACAAAVSMLLLACNDADRLNASGGDENTPILNIDKDKEKQPYDLPPYIPGPTIIEKDVEKWMEEQLASGSDEKKLINIFDMHITETSPPGLSAFGRSDINGEYFVEYSFNGEKISAEEYYRIQEEYRKGINTGKRDLSIPGEIMNDSYSIWTVLMTAEEIAELLSKKYYEISISFVHAGGNAGNNFVPPSFIENTVMDSRVVSYQGRWNMNGYYDKLGGYYGGGYGNGFTDDEDILKSWFPDIFNEESAKSECNYFALYFTSSSSGLSNSYEILSQDMVLYSIGCTWKRGLGVETCDFARRAMLICDDKAGTLRKSIDLDSGHFYNDPDWECESGEGGPNWEDMYF